jgi:hypothetical protein
MSTDKLLFFIDAYFLLCIVGAGIGVGYTISLLIATRKLSEEDKKLFKNFILLMKHPSSILKKIANKKLFTACFIFLLIYAGNRLMLFDLYGFIVGIIIGIPYGFWKQHDEKKMLGI